MKYLIVHIKCLFFLSGLIFFTLPSSGYYGKTDSLRKLLLTAKEDTQKVILLNLLAYEIAFSNPEEAMKFALDAKSLALKLDYKNGLCRSYSNLGAIYNYRGEYSKSEEEYIKGIAIAEEYGNNRALAVLYNNLGLGQVDRGRYDAAFNYYMKSLKIKEEIGDKQGIANAYQNIGNIFFQQGLYQKSMDYQLKSLQIKNEIGDEWGLANLYNNIGIIYWNMDSNDKARKYYEKALPVYKKYNDLQSMAETLNNLGIIYAEANSYNLAMKYYFEALHIKENLGDKEGMANAFNCIARVHYSMRHLDTAALYFEIGLRLTLEIGAPEWQKDAYRGLADVYAAKNDFQRAYNYHKLFVSLKDTMLNQESSKQITEMQTRYETEKKEKEIALQKTEIIKKEAVIKQQNIQRIALASGFALMLALAFVVFRAYRNKRKANKIISAQKAEVELQKDVIEEKNKNIIDSIEYASYIQNAVLPTDEEVYRLFPEAFILYKPRDIVSGDFYWTAEVESEKVRQGESEKDTHTRILSRFPTFSPSVIFALADCTGHGVPGAFMSMLCNTLLNEAVNDKGLIMPNEILDEVRKGIISALKQREGAEGSKDGMDCSLIHLTPRSPLLEERGRKSPSLKEKNMEGAELPSPQGEGLGVRCVIACANNPVYIVRNHQLIEIKPDRQPVGFSYYPKPFTCHEIELKKGDMVYLISDGYEDQIGGEKEKKFKSRQLKELLVSIFDKPVQEQKDMLEKTFAAWKGGREQTDDVTIIGIKV